MLPYIVWRLVLLVEIAPRRQNVAIMFKLGVGALSRIRQNRLGRAFRFKKATVDANDRMDDYLICGQPAEVLILSEEHTVLDELLDPIVASVDRSFRE